MGGFFGSGQRQRTRESVRVAPQGAGERAFEGMAFEGIKRARGFSDFLGRFADRIEPTLQALLAETRAGAAEPDISALISGEGRGISREIRRVLTEDFRRSSSNVLERGRSEGAAISGALGLGGSPGAAPSRDAESAVVATLGNLLLQSPTALDAALAIQNARLSRRSANTAALGPLQGLVLGARGLQLGGIQAGLEGALGGRGQDLSFRANTAERSSVTTGGAQPSLFDVGLTGLLAGRALFPPAAAATAATGLFSGGGTVSPFFRGGR